MKKVFVFSGWAVLSCLFFSSCALTAHVQKDATVRFNSFKTYSWSLTHAVDSNSRFDNPIVQANLHHEINAEMARKGWVLVNEQADVVLDYSLSTMQVVHRSNTTPYYSTPYVGLGMGMSMIVPYGRGFVRVATPYTYAPYYSPYSYGGRPYTTIDKEGTLNLRMYRATDNRLIWQSTVENTLNKNVMTQKDIEQYAKAALQEL
jgi:hypothetical protein